MTLVIKEMAGRAVERQVFELAAEAHQRERLKLEERYAAVESRWLTEVDRARQQAKQL